MVYEETLLQKKNLISYHLDKTDKLDLRILDIQKFMSPDGMYL